MGKRSGAYVSALFVAFTAYGIDVSISHAFSNYGPQVDQACAGFNGTSPYSDQNCALCHDSGNLGRRIDPAWTWWDTGNLTAFCPDPVNQAPNGTIDSPTGNRAINVGDSVAFAATGSDPDDNLPLSYHWDFGGGAVSSNNEDPGVVVFSSAGTYRVTLTVTDVFGLSDPTPATRTVVVNEIVTVDCTDNDADGFAVEGDTCGPVDCNDNSASINPGTVESCTDGIDNNCNGLIDAADPLAENCPGVEGCLDNDGDGFSSDGGVCGPIDCDDFTASINPSASEICGDGLDNDCDGAFDADDRECNGSDCISVLFTEDPVPDDGDIDNPPSFTIASAEWDAREGEFSVEGDQMFPGELVTLIDANTGAILAITTVESDGEWEFEMDNPSQIPCRVRVEINGQFAERDVLNAPSDCIPRDDDQDGTDDPDTGTDGAPSIRVVKTGPATIAEGGVDVTWSFTITADAGNAPTDPVTVTSVIDDRLGALTAVAVAANGGAPIVLNPGTSFSFNYNPTGTLVLNAGESHTNTVTVTGQDDEGTLATDDDFHTVIGTNVAPRITVVKTGPATIIEGGADVSWSFTITANASNVSTDPVTVTSVIDDRLGALTAVAVAANGGAPIVLNPGASFSFDYNPAGTLVLNAGESHTNTVTVTGQDDEGTLATDDDFHTVTGIDNPGTGTFTITTAEWDARDRELDVRGGQASPRQRVRLIDADTGVILATTRVRRNGQWRFELEDPSRVPCRVRIEIDGQFVERDVVNAPAYCGPTDDDTDDTDTPDDDEFDD